MFGETQQKLFGELTIGDLDKIRPYTCTQIIIGRLSIGNFIQKLPNAKFTPRQYLPSLLHTTLWLPLHLNRNTTPLYLRMISTCMRVGVLE